MGKYVIAGENPLTNLTKLHIFQSMPREQGSLKMTEVRHGPGEGRKKKTHARRKEEKLGPVKEPEKSGIALDNSI